MSEHPPPRILTINTGSSSLKAGLYRTDGTGGDARLDLRAEVERIGRADAHLRVVNLDGGTVAEERHELLDHGAAVQALLAWLDAARQTAGLAAVGHRVVHGGPDYAEPCRLTAEVRAELERLIPLAPSHLPQALMAIDVTSRTFPNLPEIACFDTAFHRQMPGVAQGYALPRRLRAAGIQRYGFHGLSCESIVAQLRALDGDAAGGRTIIAHLGNGASLTAAREGRSLDTTMGFTPTGGLMMGTRSGDLDPGVLLYLLESMHLTTAALADLVNREAGLLGVSGVSGDMRDLLAREATDPNAAEAVALFCYQARKFLGALTTPLGGLDTLVFTGGIGEHAAPVRARICADLAYFGIELDPERNRTHAPVISQDGAAVRVRVLRTDEDQIIAQHTIRALQQ